MGLEWNVARECEDATQFMGRMERLDRRVAFEMNARLEKRATVINRSRKLKPSFKEEEWVWYLRPRGQVGTGLYSWWLGPCKVVARTGRSSYEILAKPQVFQNVHRDQLKPVIRPWLPSKPLTLFKYRSGYQPEGLGQKELGPAAVLNHRIGPNGQLELLVHWADTPSEKDSWESATELGIEYHPIVKEYLLQNGLEVETQSTPEDYEAHMEPYDYSSSESEDSLMCI